MNISSCVNTCALWTFCTMQCSAVLCCFFCIPCWSQNWCDRLDWSEIINIFMGQFFNKRRQLEWHRSLNNANDSVPFISRPNSIKIILSSFFVSVLISQKFGVSQLKFFIWTMHKLRMMTCQLNSRKENRTEQNRIWTEQSKCTCEQLNMHNLDIRMTRFVSPHHTENSQQSLTIWLFILLFSFSFSFLGCFNWIFFYLN